MELYRYLDYYPTLSQGVYISPGAKIIGRAILHENVNIWFNVVVRADVNKIEIGKNTNVQDLSMLHVTEKNHLILGENVSIGHSVVMHGCTVEDSCLIGMGAIILDGAVIGRNSVVAAGTLVPPGKVYPPFSMIKGRPAILERELTDQERLSYGNHYKSYIGYKDQYLNMK